MSSWKIDPSKRDYSVSGGAPVQDLTVLTPAYIRLVTPRKRWMYAPNDSYGSDYPNIQSTRVSDVVVAEEAGKRALKPLVDDGRAQTVTVETTEVTRGGVGLQFRLLDNRGRPQVLKFTPVR